MMRVIKTYGNEKGWSCTFRQWRAESHCHFIHGYALGVQLEFCCLDKEVDENGWVINFGGLKEVEAWLKWLFDHKTIVAEDDPELEHFEELRTIGLIQLIVLPAVGCDNLAKYISTWVTKWLEDQDTKAWLHRVRVFEHAGNAAEWTRC